MSGGPAVTPSPGNVEAALVRLEGKLDRVIDGMARQADDTRVVRERLHEHANELTALTALDIPTKLGNLRDGQEGHELRLRPIEVEVAKIDTIQKRLDKHDLTLRTVESDLDQRKGAANVIRALWAVVCLVGLGGIIAIVKALVGH